MEIREIFIIVLILTVIGISVSFATNFSLISAPQEALDFCSNEQECINFLESEGMPDNYLEENGITISCEEGVCYATK